MHLCIGQLRRPSNEPEKRFDKAQVHQTLAELRKTHNSQKARVRRKYLNTR